MNSNNLGLPFIMPAQAQKHVTFNEAIKSLDTIVQLAVVESDVSIPPTTPNNGDRYAISVTPSGIWSGHAQEVAIWETNAWRFVTPKIGWRIWDTNLSRLLVYTDNSWQPIVSPSNNTHQNLELLGVNATADTQNRFTVSAPSSLLTHAGNGHRTIINKKAPADTASFIFQSDFSAKAELGLLGNNALSLKTSIDGLNWQTRLEAEPEYNGIQTPALRSGKIIVGIDSTVSIPTPSSGGIFAITLTSPVGFPQSTHTGLFVYDTGASLSLITLLALSGFENLGDTPLSGTTGLNEKTSISAQNATLQIENRFRIDREYSYVFLC